MNKFGSEKKATPTRAVLANRSVELQEKLERKYCTGKFLLKTGLVD